MYFRYLIIIFLVMCLSTTSLYPDEPKTKVEESGNKTTLAKKNLTPAKSSSLPFTVSITIATPKILPEYLDNIHAVTKDQSMYQDWPNSTAVIEGEFWVILKCGYSNRILRYKGTNIEDAVLQPDGHLNLINKTWGTVVAPYILGGMWYDSNEKKLFAPMHCEYPSAYGGSDEFGTKLNRQIHLASSTDKGLTWNYEGPIITRDDPKTPHGEPEYSGSLWDGGEGDFYFFADEKEGYVYVYTSHNLWPKPGNNSPRFWAHHVARCAISDQLAPGKWQKFYNGGWSEPALGGKASYVEAYNVIYSSNLKKYISFNYGGGISYCTDLGKQDWSPSFYISGGLWGANNVWAWSPVDASKNNITKFDKTMFVYTYWAKKPGVVYKLDFGEGETRDTFGYTGAGVATPGFAHTMIPIRPYGEPLLDNADPIESRRVRKVNCENPEMTYVGEWTSQLSPVKAKISGITNNSVAFVFKGSGIYWRVATGLDCGKVDVYLDETFQKTVDLYGDFTPYMFGFTKIDLDTKVPHTIKVIANGEKNAKSSGTLVKHMSFEYVAESYQASEGFCSVKGKNQWHYLTGDGTSQNNLEFNHFKNAWVKSKSFVTIGPDFQIADDTNESIRKWVAPHAGLVRIEGIISLNGVGGEGVKTRILHNKDEVWPSRIIFANNPLPHDFNLEVVEGDSIFFCVNKNIKNVNEHTNWDPVITFVKNKASLNKETMSLSMEEHGSNPNPQNIIINYSGQLKGHAFKGVSDVPWLSVSTVSGDGKGETLQCAVNLKDPTSGVYSGRVTITHKDLSDVDIPNVLTCEIIVRVNGAPRAKSLSVSPGLTVTSLSENLQFTTQVLDQFGNSYNGKLAWSVSGGGSIDNNGLFKSDGTRGVFTVTCRLSNQEALTASAKLEVVSELDFFANWKLNETSGNEVADSVGNKRMGKLIGSMNETTWSKTLDRSSLYFNGVDNVVDTGFQLKDLKVPFAFTFWVNPAATQVEYADIFGNHDGSFGLVMQQDSKKTNSFGFGYGDGQQGYGPGVVQLVAGEWQHVVVVCDGEKAVCYVNGIEKCSSVAKGVFVNNSNMNFKLGQGYKENRFFHGFLSDVRIYPRALSSKEIMKMVMENKQK